VSFININLIVDKNSKCSDFELLAMSVAGKDIGRVNFGAWV
jgi:hypothetical protein